MQDDIHYLSLIVISSHQMRADRIDYVESYPVWASNCDPRGPAMEACYKGAGRGPPDTEILGKKLNLIDVLPSILNNAAIALSMGNFAYDTCLAHSRSSGECQLMGGRLT